MPSQMLEEWLWDPQIVRMISGHYKTGESLSDEQINNIVRLKHFDSAMTARTQARYALLALQCHMTPDADPYSIMQTVQKQYAPQIYCDPENHFYANFGHLTGYGAKYYGYLWSKVFALDLFDEIKRQGLLNPAMGKRYATTILAPGGSKPPHLLLIDFLGREPRTDAFVKDLGI
jgi:thimet oligopeptidase